MELDWWLEFIHCSISSIAKLQARFAVNKDASESEWGKLIEKTPLEYFALRRKPFVRL